MRAPVTRQRHASIKGFFMNNGRPSMRILSGNATEGPRTRASHLRVNRARTASVPNFSHTYKRTLVERKHLV